MQYLENNEAIRKKEESKRKREERERDKRRRKSVDNKGEKPPTGDRIKEWKRPPSQGDKKRELC